MSHAAESRARAAATNFIEQFGLLCEADGMPRIAGRIVGLLVLSEEPCDLEGIAERLQISHGSVSTNTRLLENLGIVERITLPGDRRVHFRIGPDPAGHLLERTLQRQRRLDDLVVSTLEALPTNAPGRRGLDAIHAFQSLSIRRTRAMLDEWAEYLRSASAPRASLPRGTSGSRPR